MRTKHTAAVVFCLLILLPLLLITGLQTWQAFLKHQWKERLEHQTAQTVKFPLAAVVWEERGRELKLGDCLFDVISCHVEGNYLVATGVYDVQETRLETFLNTQFSHSGKSRSVVQLLLVLQSLAVFVRWFFQLSAPAPVSSFYGSLLNRYPHPFTGICTPPPRFFYSYP